MQSAMQSILLCAETGMGMLLDYLQRQHDVCDQDFVDHGIAQ